MWRCSVWIGRHFARGGQLTYFTGHALSCISFSKLKAIIFHQNIIFTKNDENQSNPDHSPGLRLPLMANSALGPFSTPKFVFFVTFIYNANILHIQKKSEVKILF